MVKLVCALVGVKGSALSVTIDPSELVYDLKKAIKAERGSFLRAVDADNLQLFLAKTGDAWLESGADEVKKLKKGETTAAIEALTHEDNELQGESGLQRVLAAMPEPSSDQIHVLVVVPESTAPLSSAVINQMEMSLSKVLDERDQRRSEYSISTCPRGKEDELKHQLGLEYESVPVNEVADDSIERYEWSKLIENHADQRRAYVKYIETHAHDAFMTRQKQTSFLKDVAGMRNLLDCDDRRRLPFKVKGTADLMIVDEEAERMNDVFAGLRLVIEVKKTRPGYDERWQILLELVVADLKSEGRCAPVGLLTNLDDYWYFLWFTPTSKIARMVLTCPANGFKMMKAIVKERSKPSKDGIFPMPAFDSSLPLKRQKLLRGATGRDDAAAETLERYELMSDELSPKFLLERKMDYAFDLISQMPIHSHMYS